MQRQRAPFVLVLPLVLAACGRGPIGIAPAPSADGSLVTSIEGVSPELRRDVPLMLRLLCGKEAKSLIEVASAPAPASGAQLDVTFKGVKAKAGDVCAVEIEAKDKTGLPQGRFEWLTEKTGLFYVGEATALDATRRLKVALYSVFRDQQPGGGGGQQQNDAVGDGGAEGDVVVDGTVGGACATWNAVTRKCDDGAGNAVDSNADAGGGGLGNGDASADAQADTSASASSATAELQSGEWRTRCHRRVIVTLRFGSGSYASTEQRYADEACATPDGTASTIAGTYAVTPVAGAIWKLRVTTTVTDSTRFALVRGDGSLYIDSHEGAGAQPDEHTLQARSTHYERSLPDLSAP